MIFKAASGPRAPAHFESLQQVKVGFISEKASSILPEPRPLPRRTGGDASRPKGTPEQWCAAGCDEGARHRRRPLPRRRPPSKGGGHSEWHCREECSRSRFECAPICPRRHPVLTSLNISRSSSFPPRHHIFDVYRCVTGPVPCAPHASRMAFCAATAASSACAGGRDSRSGPGPLVAAASAGPSWSPTPSRRPRPSCLGAAFTLHGGRTPRQPRLLVPKASQVRGRGVHHLSPQPVLRIISYPHLPLSPPLSSGPPSFRPFCIHTNCWCVCMHVAIAGMTPFYCPYHSGEG